MFSVDAANEWKEHESASVRVSCRTLFYSTPCGINEVVTPELFPIVSLLVGVLNALRHQRSCHYVAGVLDGQQSGAQRLAASTKLSHS